MFDSAVLDQLFGKHLPFDSTCSRCQATIIIVSAVNMWGFMPSWYIASCVRSWWFNKYKIQYDECYRYVCCHSTTAHCISISMPSCIHHEMLNAFKAQSQQDRVRVFEQAISNPRLPDVHAQVQCRVAHLLQR